MNGHLTFRGRNASAFRKNHGPGQAEVEQGRCMLELKAGFGPYRTKIFIPNLFAEFRKNVEIKERRLTFELLRPVSCSVPVRFEAGDFKNLILTLNYRDQGGWDVRSVARINDGTAVICGPSNPATRVVVEVRGNRSVTTTSDLIFASRIMRKSMTMGELLRGLTVRATGSAKVWLGPRDREILVDIMSPLAASSQKVRPGKRLALALPVGKKNWEMRIDGSLPFPVRGGGTVDLDKLKLIESVILAKVLRDFVGSRAYFVTVNARFFSARHLRRDPIDLRVMSGVTYYGSIRFAEGGETVPITAVCEKQSLKLSAKW